VVRQEALIACKGDHPGWPTAGGAGSTASRPSSPPCGTSPSTAPTTPPTTSRPAWSAATSPGETATPTTHAYAASSREQTWP